MSTNEKALEVLMYRQLQEQKLNEQLRIECEEKQHIQTLQQKNFFFETKLKTSTILKSEEIKKKKKTEANEVKYEKREIAHKIVQEQQDLLIEKKKKRDEIKKV